MPTLQATTSGHFYSVLQLPQYLLQWYRQGPVLVSEGVFVHKLLGNGGISSKAIQQIFTKEKWLSLRKLENSIFFKIVLPEL